MHAYHNMSIFTHVTDFANQLIIMGVKKRNWLLFLLIKFQLIHFSVPVAVLIQISNKINHFALST